MGNAAEKARAEERQRAQVRAAAQQQQFNEALEEAKRQRELEEAVFQRRQAEAQVEKEEAEIKEQRKVAQLKAEAEERRREMELQHKQRLEELKHQEKERREEERRQKEEREQLFKQQQEKQAREEAIRKREKEEADERQRELMREMHARDQEHAQHMLELQERMHRASLDAQKEKEEQIRKEREVQQQLADKQLSDIRTLHKEDLEHSQQRHDQMIKVMQDQLDIQRETNNNMLASLGVLMQQFSDSRNDFLKYVETKPQQDIVVPENMEETLRKAKQDLGLDTANCYNFAFVGQTKTGKSSLINAIRGIEDTHPDAAKVGITETTHLTAPFSFPDGKFEHVKIYDIPGAGTLTHNSDSYYQDKCLCAFDCLVILTQDTLGKAEIDFAIQSLRYNQPIAFVRSRCDVVLDNAKKKKEIKRVDQNAVFSYISKMSEFFIEEIKRAEKPELSRVPVFFVSAYSLRDLINGEEPEAVYHEQAFLDYIKAKSMFSRNIIT